mmetsp:Transcript_27508/g.72303  ORF Transcript_27508/g.72303 Transcript_27508/m.72303 type:complete len:352 (+) Transcript_27508:99-1154(+)
MATAAESAAQFPDGIYPVMLTPFTPDGAAVDHECLAALSEWYIQSGSVGLFPVAQSSEMYALSPEERIECARTVKRAAAGRVPVLASGTFGGPVEEQAAFVKTMAAEVDAVVVLVCNLATAEEGDDVWLDRCQKLLDLTPGIKLGLYECPAPYHRLLSPTMLEFCAKSNRFVWIKDTSRENELISAKIGVLRALPQTPLRWFNGNVTTLSHSLQAGSQGYGGVSANFYPWMHGWLCANWAKAPEQARKVQRFLTVAEATVKTKYPASAKVYLRQAYPHFDISPFTRVKDFAFLPEDMMKLRELQLMMEDVCKEIGISPVVPPGFRKVTAAKPAAAAGAAGGKGDTTAFPVD